MIDDYDKSAYVQKGWDSYGLCPCGYYQKASFGSLFHIHLEVCPVCGKNKEDEWNVVTAKVVETKLPKKKWWNFQRYKYTLEIKENSDEN